MGLFWKIFVSFGVAMTLTLVGTVYVSFRLAGPAFDQVDVEVRDRITEEAAAVLAERGERGLRGWLSRHRRSEPGIIVLVTKDGGKELLDFPMPKQLRRWLRAGPRSPDAAPPNVRPQRLGEGLVGPDGKEYRLWFARAPVTVLGILTWPGTQAAVLTISMLAAALVSFMLARYLSSPIARLQRASRALAAGALDTRVGRPFNRRKDEVGTLARDFDTMAERIQALVTDKETLLRDVSHELRSPLARIRVALALAQRRADDAAQPDLERIEREAERLDELVGQVMTLTRLRTATAPSRAPLDFGSLVSEVIEDAQFEHPNARITFTADDPVPEILGDLGGLKSAVENVVRNALIHAGAEAPIEIELRAAHDTLALRVLDRGPGVADEDLARIFEPFYRADKGRDHQKNGQGIGLAITARVMELHGGSVRAANRPEGGLEVTLTLPLRPHG
jgi:two-component system sensor histidine kinase CpxA